MVQLDDPLVRYTTDLINRLSLMSLVPDLHYKLRQPASDPSHLAGRHKQAILRNKQPLEKPALAAGIHNYQKYQQVGTLTPVPGDEPARTDVEDRPEVEVLGQLVPRPVPSISSPAARPKVRLSYPIGSSSNLRSEPSRPLTPILRVHCSCIHKPVAVSPLRLDFLKRLPVDITITLLQSYIYPKDLLSVRGVSRYYKMMCDLRVVKRRWTSFQQEEKLRITQLGQENVSRTPRDSKRPMSRSTGVLSPIQAAGLASPTLLWQALHTPHKDSPARTSPHSRRNVPFFLSPARLPPPPSSPSRPSPATPHRDGPSPATPHRIPPARSASPGSSAPRRPAKRAPSVADIKHDGAVPTPEKQTEDRRTARGSGFVTPSKRSIETRRKDASRGSSCAKSDRTPFATLNFTTPNTSTCSSKTSLSSTASLVTPELYNSKHRARRYLSPGPGPALQQTDGFKVPAPSLAPSSVKSRQRLRRL